MYGLQLVDGSAQRHVLCATTQGECEARRWAKASDSLVWPLDSVLPESLCSKVLLPLTFVLSESFFSIPKRMNEVMRCIERGEGAGIGDRRVFV